MTVPAGARAALRRERQEGWATGPPLSHTEVRLPGSYQVPPLVAEQPPLSFEPVAQLRVVVPVLEREMTNVTFVGSRVEPTVIV